MEPEVFIPGPTPLDYRRVWQFATAPSHPRRLRVPQADRTAAATEVHHPVHGSRPVGPSPSLDASLVARVGASQAKSPPPCLGDGTEALAPEAGEQLLPEAELRKVRRKATETSVEARARRG